MRPRSNAGITSKGDVEREIKSRAGITSRKFGTFSSLAGEFDLLLLSRRYAFYFWESSVSIAGASSGRRSRVELAAVLGTH